MNAIDNLCEVLLYLEENFSKPVPYDKIRKIWDSLEEITIDSDSQYRIGLKLIKSPSSSLVYFGVKMLFRSRCKEAIEPIKKMLCYDAHPGQGTDHYQDSIDVVELASKALETLVGDDSELQYQMGYEALDSPWTSINVWGKEMIAKSGRKETTDVLKTSEDAHAQPDYVI